MCFVFILFVGLLVVAYRNEDLSFLGACGYLGAMIAIVAITVALRWPPLILLLAPVAFNIILILKIYGGDIPLR